MPQYEFKLTGAQAAIGAVVIAGIVMFRLTTVGDQVTDEALMKQLEIQLTSEYLPEHVAKMKAMWESGTKEEVANLGEYATSTKLNILSVQASYPLFSFASSQDVIVKVEYSVDNAQGNIQSGTEYYRFTHSVVGNTWSYQHDTGETAYYLNFL